jgi:hypothetical protein
VLLPTPFPTAQRHKLATQCFPVLLLLPLHHTCPCLFVAFSTTPSSARGVEIIDSCHCSKAMVQSRVAERIDFMQGASRAARWPWRSSIARLTASPHLLHFTCLRCSLATPPHGRSERQRWNVAVHQHVVCMKRLLSSSVPCELRRTANGAAIDEHPTVLA